jgi:hypothetical protein
VIVGSAGNSIVTIYVFGPSTRCVEKRKRLLQLFNARVMQRPWQSSRTWPIVEPFVFS